MFCSNCGSKLLEGSNQCLHCGRIETSVSVDAAARPVWEEERRRRKLPWVVGILTGVLVVALAVLVFWPEPLPTPGPPPGPPPKPAYAVRLGTVPPVESGPSEGWGVAYADVQPEGTDALAWVQPAELDADRSELVVAVASSKTKTYVRALGTQNGGTAWQKVLPGRAACGFDRVESLVCLSSTLELTIVNLKTGEAQPPKTGKVEAPSQVWVSPSGGIFVLSIGDPGEPKPVRTLSVTLTRVDADAKTVWTQAGQLPAQEGHSAQLVGTDALVAVQTVTFDDRGVATTPTLLLTQDKGTRIGGFKDGSDITLLDNGWLGAYGGERSTVFDSSGKELFGVAGRVTRVGVRDLPGAEVPGLAVSYPKPQPGGAPQPPQLLRFEASGAASSLGQGVPRGVCAGQLVTENYVAAPNAYAAQTLDKGTRTWGDAVHAGTFVSGACDGKRFLALTADDGLLVLRAYAMSVGEPAFKPLQLKDRSFVGFFHGIGWMVRDEQQKRYVMVRG